MRTARQHFNEDVARSRALLAHAATLPDEPLRGDVFRAAWMMAVGACDAFFCDAYADLLTRTLRASSQQPAVKPPRLKTLRVPLITMVQSRYPTRPGWQWRMAARQLIEDESVLSIKKIRDLFNHFCDDQNKFVNQNTIGSWITHRAAKKRMFGIAASEYRSRSDCDKRAARDAARRILEQRFQTIFQRRHDCIHNCDRPKIALQGIGEAAVQKVIEDVEFLVNRCEETLRQEFSSYLARLGFEASVRANVLAGF